jgi:S-DNA-T family DNA segregation ATPase FtsK/SpoIIIE
MAKKKLKLPGMDAKRKILGVLLLLFCVLLLISVLTHSSWDDTRIHAQDNPFKIQFRNHAGTVGAFTSYVLFFFFGWLSVFIPLFLGLAGLRYLGAQWRSKIRPAILFTFLSSLFVTMMTDIYLLDRLDLALGYSGGNGGYVSYSLTKLLVKIIGRAGSVLLLGAGIICSLILLGYFYPGIRKKIRLPLKLDKSKIRPVFNWIIKKSAALVAHLRLRKKATPSENIEYAGGQNRDGSIDVAPPSGAANQEARPAGVSATPEEVSGRGRKGTRKAPGVPKISAGIGRETMDFVFPGLDLLSDNPDGGSTVGGEELAHTARALRDTLATFGIAIDGEIEKKPGPVITRFEFKPAAGVKVHQITNLSDDLALALQAKRVRIVAPIPGKAAIGVEIPNRKARLVYIKEIIDSDVYAGSNADLPLALGKTIAGQPFVTDLAKMPHLLIAGATGSGKSVCINAIITSLIYRLHPRELKYIFIDPKMLELSVYAGIPYLNCPVVTNTRRAEKVLADAVVEMENRYRRLANESVRNIRDYNARQKNISDRMPYIVIIVDELADMMMAAASPRIEMLITRLAQMARAVGIHLILATQRPSVDVITGLIKANFSARIAFQVATKIDSRTIIDGNGAEKLLGYGDMLFLQPGQPEPMRLHGAFISGEETERIVKFINDQFPGEEKPASTEDDTVEDDDQDDADVDDPLFLEAAQTVVRHKQGSVSLLQRKLGIGYQRAARLIDRLESAGIVGPYDGSKAREVLVDNSYIEQLMTTSRSSLSDPNPQ